jgi:hypothetical protein
MNNMEIWYDINNLQDSGTMDILALKEYKQGKQNPLNLIFKKYARVWDYGRSFTRTEKVFYWLKTLICIILRLYRDKQVYDEIAMLAFDYCAGNWEYSGTDWTEIAVGEGIFKNWYLIIYINGTH